MKKYISMAVTAALALFMSGMPAALAHADANGGDGQGGIGASATMTVTGEGDAAANVTASGTMSVQTEQVQELSRAREQERAASSTSGQEASTSGSENAQENSQGPEHASESAFEHANSFLFQGAASTTLVADVSALKQSIQTRRQEIESIIASSTPADRQVLENASSTAVAVHAFLASRDLLGGVGQQVSQIAAQVSQALATTTSAEAQIQSRGFWARLFFGGDSQAGNAIAQTVTQTQANIAQLTSLLNQASTTADVKATLQVQIQAMQQEQTRLQDLANQQKGLWGLFSWRF